MKTCLPWNTPLVELLSESQRQALAPLVKMECQFLASWTVYETLAQCIRMSTEETRPLLDTWVRFFLDQGVPVCLFGIKPAPSFSQSPLCAVLNKEEMEWLKLILDIHPNLCLNDPDNPNQDWVIGGLFVGRTPETDFSEKRLEMFDLLLQHGLCVDDDAVVDLGLRCWGCVDVLLKHGKSPRVIYSFNGMNLLMLWLIPAPFEWSGNAQRCSLEKIKQGVDFFINAGVDINAQDGDGWSAIYYAASHYPDLLPYLIEKGADPTLCTPKGNTFLHEMVGSGRVHELPSDYGLINGVNAKGQTALHQLSYRYSEGAILIMEEANLDQYLEDNTPKYIQEAQWLLDRGALINQANEDQELAWHMGVFGLPDTMEFWLEKGANIHAPVGGLSLFGYLANSDRGYRAMEVLARIDVHPKEEDFTPEQWLSMEPVMKAWLENSLLQQQSEEVSLLSTGSRRL